MSDVLEIELNPYEDECKVCEKPVSYSRSGPACGIPVYEDRVLSDDDEGEWAGFTVCTLCYHVAESMRNPDGTTIQEILAVVRGEA